MPHSFTQPPARISVGPALYILHSKFKDVAKRAWPQIIGDYSE